MPVARAPGHIGRRGFIGGGIALAVAAAVPRMADAQFFDVPYVPTPQVVVDEMLRQARGSVAGIEDSLAALRRRLGDAGRRRVHACFSMDDGADFLAARFRHGKHSAAA